MKTNIMADEHRCNCGAGTLRRVVAAVACQLRNIYVCRACGALCDVWDLHQEEHNNGSGTSEQISEPCPAPAA